MRVHARLEKLKREVRDRPPPDLLDLVVAVPVGSGMADGLPPGVHFNADGRVATVVFAGAAPDKTVIASLDERLSKWGEVIVATPDPCSAPAEGVTCAR